MMWAGKKKVRKERSRLGAHTLEKEQRQKKKHERSGRQGEGTVTKRNCRRRIDQSKKGKIWEKKWASGSEAALKKKSQRGPFKERKERCRRRRVKKSRKEPLERKNTFGGGRTDRVQWRISHLQSKKSPCGKKRISMCGTKKKKGFFRNLCRSGFRGRSKPSTKGRGNDPIPYRKGWPQPGKGGAIERARLNEKARN